jgi:hypothetical protein
MITNSLFGGNILSSRGNGDHRAKYGSRENMPTANDATTNGAVGTCGIITLGSDIKDIIREESCIMSSVMLQ